MTRIQGRYFSMDEARLASVARLTGYPEPVVKELALDADWSDTGHQEWLDTEDVNGIASWLGSFPADAIDELR